MSSSSGSSGGGLASTAPAELYASNAPPPIDDYSIYLRILAGSVLFHTRDMVLSMTLGTIYIPFDRVATLMTVEGELKRQGVLGLDGFGGIRSCWLQLWAREGVLGCMRSALWTPVLRFPTRLIGDVYSTTFCHFCFRRFPEVDQLFIMVVAMVSSVCVTAPYNVLQRLIRNLYRADLKLAKETHETDDAVAPPPHSNVLVRLRHRWRRSVVGRWWRGCILSQWCRGREEVRYHYANIFQMTLTLTRLLRPTTAFMSMVVVEMVYKNIFMWMFPILLNIIPVVSGSFWGRGITLGLRDVLMQPFRVVMGRMAVSAGFIPVGVVARGEDGGVEGQRRAAPRHRMYSSPVECVRTIIADEGVRGLWAGLRYRLLLSTLAWLSVLIAPPPNPNEG